jgi:serine/threonine protein kinase
MLRHQRAHPVYEVAVWQGRPCIVLEYLEGGSLAAKLNGQPQPPSEAARLVEALARAIHAAHQRGIVHRDLKPANVLLAEDGTPRIADFGLAKRLEGGAGQTAGRAVLGTPSYMAPEQAGGKSRSVGPGSDVHALGAVLSELLTGRPPFQGDSAMETLQQVRTEEPLPPRQLRRQVAADLETICLKCLQKDPARRDATALELAEDLQRFGSGRPILARPVGRLERSSSF